jgi:hypothetical protein
MSRFSGYVSDRAYQCQGKHSFEKKSQAKAAAKQQQSYGGGGPINAYRCPHCNFWHTGHAPDNRDFERKLAAKNKVGQPRPTEADSDDEKRA